MAKLQYGLVLIHNAKVSERVKIQRLQNRALLETRYVSNLVLHQRAKVLPIDLRIKYGLMVLMFKRTRRDHSDPDRTGSPGKGWVILFQYPVQIPTGLFRQPLIRAR